MFFSVAYWVTPKQNVEVEKHQNNSNIQTETTNMEEIAEIFRASVQTIIDPINNNITVKQETEEHGKATVHLTLDHIKQTDDGKTTECLEEINFKIDNILTTITIIPDKI
ncbi:hypothetical protein Bpfe_007200 [Biomphalaria pfeifferi]|uniref:Uncharacterized protein n=1 Tax=Biomphalaria pfeifferi TaxID=112525 RepID=A0AAD8FHP9_BIOPF|nr:hypothetical protein Bpfe_007200 [Biomphalaria pfeifferi]